MGRSARGDKSGTSADQEGGGGNPKRVEGIGMKWDVGNGVNFGVERDQAIGSGDPSDGITDDQADESADGADGEPLQEENAADLFATRSPWP